MSLIRPLNASRPRRGRPARPSCRGGASSLLRLTPPALAKLPSAPELSDWIERAASALVAQSAG